MLELDHVIHFAPGPGTVDLTGFTIEPGRVHTGQGTRNVRVMFERSYLEILWIEHPADVLARGLDFIGRCARPYAATPFGCVLRGTIPPAIRPRFRAYQVPDAPGFVLQILADASTDAPFIAVFETDDREAMWPAHRALPAYQLHPSGQARIHRATFTSPAAPPVDPPTDVAFRLGPPRLDLDLGDRQLTLRP